MYAALDALLGKPLASDEEDEQKVGVLQGVPMLGLDALASSAYGPEAALTLLLPLGLAGAGYLQPIILVILGILALLYFSYRQTLAAYPSGGGSYTVAKENLGLRFGLLAAAALLLDYVLNVAVGISAGVAALESAVPALHRYTLPLCLGVLVLITVVNLRGVRESGFAWAIPTYLFIASMAAVLGIGLFHAFTAGGHPRPVTPPPTMPPAAQAVSFWLLIRAFASGCTAMTGVEAVSNGVTAFAEPRARGAQRTLTVIVTVLAALLLGIAYLAHAYGIGAMLQDRPGYQSVISQIVAAVVGRGWFYYVTLGSVLAVLCLSANTSFAGFPRLCRLLAEDGFLPHAFANRGRRLVYTLGIMSLCALAAGLLVLFGGITDRLIPLFAVGAFLAFTLSQAGMVLHWKRSDEPRARWFLLVNAVGAAATGVALAVVIVAKFREGAWVTLLLIPAVVTLFYRVRRHYTRVRIETRCRRPLDVSGLEPPVVVLPIVDWNMVTAKALRFALRLTDDLVVVHVGADDEAAAELCRQWQEEVERPLREAGHSVPRLDMVPSPYRFLVTPILNHVRQIEQEHPERQIAVVIPELVGGSWWTYLLHNQRTSLLKGAFLVSGDRRIAVINVPWYLGEAVEAEQAPGKNVAPARKAERAPQPSSR